MRPTALWPVSSTTTAATTGTSSTRCAHGSITSATWARRRPPRTCTTTPSATGCAGCARWAVWTSPTPRPGSPRCCSCGCSGADMDPDRVDPALREALEQQPRLDLERWWVRDLAALRSRLIPWDPTPDVVLSTVREGGARLRIYTPDRSNGSALLWVHGGGLVGDAARVDDRFCGRTALELGVTVVSVDHRLAQRHPFPAALDDAHAGWSWLQVHAPVLGIDRTRIAVGGRSSGGGIAASLVQRVRDDGDEDAAAQWLWSPMLDDRTAADRRLDAVDHPVWNNRANRVGWRAYLGAE